MNNVLNLNSDFDIDLSIQFSDDIFSTKLKTDSIVSSSTNILIG